jgi:hypothetical protein
LLESRQKLALEGQELLIVMLGQKDRHSFSAAAGFLSDLPLHLQSPRKTGGFLARTSGVKPLLFPLLKPTDQGPEESGMLFSLPLQFVVTHGHSRYPL